MSFIPEKSNQILKENGHEVHQRVPYIGSNLLWIFHIGLRGAKI